MIISTIVRHTEVIVCFLFSYIWRKEFSFNLGLKIAKGLNLGISSVHDQEMTYSIDIPYV